MRSEFITSITDNQAAFGLELSDIQANRLADYFEIVMKHNELLHLVGPSSPAEFAIRHILESLTLLEFMPPRTTFADVGTGAGLPAIPCLLVRDDLRAHLIESKEKKTKFLDEAVKTLGLVTRAKIIHRQFEEADPRSVTIITCRAIDKFTEKLPRMRKWANNRKLLFFGGNNLRDALQQNKIAFTEKLMPLSEQRFLFISK